MADRSPTTSPIGPLMREPALSAIRIDPAAAISVAPCEPGVRFVLRLNPNAQALDGPRPFQFDLPINTCAISDDRTIARLGPDEWLCTAPQADAATLTQDLESALTGRFHSWVDVSHRDVSIMVAGRYAREVINAGCPLDLDDVVFPPRSATRTLLGKADIILVRSSAARAYRVDCWRSFAPYVLAFLRNAAREFA